MRTTLVVVAVLAGCKGKEPPDPRPKGKLCFAANDAQLFRWSQDGKDVDYAQGQPLAIEYRGKRIPLPNTEHGFADAREGETVAVRRGDAVAESWNINFQRLGTDLCYYFRGFDPAKPDRRPGWILDANQPEDRCTCY